MMKDPVFRTKTAAVLGCGGLGNNVLAHFAGEGVGRVIFCDGDKVEEGNLDRQFLFGVADVGREKTAAAADFFTRYAPQTRICPVQKRVKTKEDLAFAASADVLAVCVDNAAARKTAIDFCKETGVPCVTAGVSGSFGQAYLWLPGKTPCPKCAGLLGKDPALPSPSSTVALAGALLAKLAIGVLKGDESKAGTLFVIDGEEISALKIKGMKGCRSCGS